MYPIALSTHNTYTIKRQIIHTTIKKTAIQSIKE